MTLIELLDAYAKKRLRGASDNTFRLYNQSIANYRKSLGHEPTLDDLDSEKIEDHMWRMVRSGLSPATANKDRSQLICVWTWAAKHGIVKTHPDVQAMKEPERAPMAWMPWEVESLLVSAAREFQPVGALRGEIFWPAMIRLVLDTGERIGAVRQLGRDAIDGNHVLVLAEFRKGKTRDRVYPLADDTVEACTRLLKHHAEKELFPWPYGENYIYARYKKILARAGLPHDRKCGFHRLRRTLASAVARAGGDATAALDHANPRTTKAYLDARIVRQQDASAILANYLRDPTLRKPAKPVIKRDVG